MLKYDKAMTTDLGVLTTAASKWEEMAGALNKVETRYGESVQKITTGGNWAGVSSGVAHSTFAGTRYEFSAAQIQAKAIASLLRGAHEKFTELRKKLESARDDAMAAGMTVSAQGQVAFDYAKLTPAERSAYHHDPDGEASIRTAVTKWQNHIDDRVKAIAELDEGVKTALGRASADSNKDAFGKGADETLSGFNAGAEGDLAKAMKPDRSSAGTKEDKTGHTFSGPKYGKEASAKAYADVFHETAQGSMSEGDLKLSGIADAYGGGRATANFGFTDQGFVSKAEASAGVRALAEGRAEYGYVGQYARAEGFAGIEGSLTAKATKEEVTVGAKGFVGAKGTLAGGAEAFGLGVGVNAEGWAGPGAEAWWGYKKDKETGVWKLGGDAGLSPLVGGKVGLEITIDPHKVSEAVGDAADALAGLFD